MSARNAHFQQWLALLTNRTKRQRSGEFLVQGVRPITLAVQHGWPISTLLHDASRVPSRWAADILDRTDAVQVAMAPELLRELGEKADEVPELVAVARQRKDDLSRIAVDERFLAVVFDRPASPGNIGTLVRSADAFSASGVIVTGHAADVYDPKTIRASTGSIFAIPVVRAPSHREVIDWARAAKAASISIVGTDEKGEVEVADCDLTGPSLLLVGNEAGGLSAAWRAACDAVVAIPISGSASSLNAATSATVVLYEATRQRRLRR